MVFFGLMKELDIFDGMKFAYEKDCNGKENDVEVVHCNTSGIFIPKAQIGCYVREGQMIGSNRASVLGCGNRGDNSTV